MKKITVIATATVLALFFSGCSEDLDGASGDFDGSVSQDNGTETQRSEERIINNEYAANIIAELLPIDEWVSIFPDIDPPRAARVTLSEDSDGVKLLSLYRNLNVPSLSSIIVTIHDAEGMRLRHQITVGTDLASWELIRKETTWPEDNPFRRVYLFKRPGEDSRKMRGLIFLNGVRVTIDYPGPFTDETTSQIEALTWRIAERLDEIYERELRALSESPPFFRDQPLPTRPDLLDPDTNGMHDAAL